MEGHKGAWAPGASGRRGGSGGGVVGAGASKVAREATCEAKGGWVGSRLMRWGGQLGEQAGVRVGARQSVGGCRGGVSGVEEGRKGRCIG